MTDDRLPLGILPAHAVPAGEMATRRRPRPARDRSLNDHPQTRLKLDACNEW